MDIIELDKILTVMHKNNVAHCQFNSDGSIATVQFKYGEYAGITQQVDAAMSKILPQEAKLYSMPAQQAPARKESDIDLALNPPADVRYPVDDGKE